MGVCVLLLPEACTRTLVMAEATLSNSRLSNAVVHGYWSECIRRFVFGATTPEVFAAPRLMAVTRESRKAGNRIQISSRPTPDRSSVDSLEESEDVVLRWRKVLRVVSTISATKA